MERFLAGWQCPSGWLLSRKLKKRRKWTMGMYDGRVFKQRKQRVQRLWGNSLDDPSRSTLSLNHHCTPFILECAVKDIWLCMSDHTIVVIWVIQIFFAQKNYTRRIFFLSFSVLLKSHLGGFHLPPQKLPILPPYLAFLQKLSPPSIQYTLIIYYSSLFCPLSSPLVCNTSFTRTGIFLCFVCCCDPDT